MSFPFKTLKGRVKKVDINPYRIKWDDEEDCLSKFEFKIRCFLKPFWSKKIVTSELPMVGTLNRFDIANITDKIIVECDGAGHSDPNYYRHESPIDYLNQLKRDHNKDEWCDINGYKMVRILPEDMPLTKEFFKKTYDIDL